MRGSFAPESLGLGCGKQIGVSVLLNGIAFVLLISLSRQSLFPQTASTIQLRNAVKRQILSLLKWTLLTLSRPLIGLMMPLQHQPTIISTKAEGNGCKWT
jgi:hypothetical protein